MDSKKEQLLALLRADPFIDQQSLADRLGLSRSAIAGHLAALTREGRILGRAYVLPSEEPIVCIGGANVDRKLRTLDTLQMGTSNPALQSETPGGVARNIAENLARLGLPTRLITAVGDDTAGRFLLEQARQAGITTQGSLVAGDAATGSYTAVLDHQGQMWLALAAMPLVERLTPEFLRRGAPQRAQAKLTVVDLNLPADSLALLIEEAHERGRALIAVAVSEPKMARLPADLTGLQCLILNGGELRALLGRDLPTEDALAALHERGVPQIVLTEGRSGIVCSEVDQLPIRMTAPIVKVVDVTGAGDAFAAGLCAGLFQAQQDLTLACRLGLHLAALTLQTEATVHPELGPGWLRNPLESA